MEKVKVAAWILGSWNPYSLTVAEQYGDMRLHNCRRMYTQHMRASNFCPANVSIHSPESFEEVLISCRLKRKLPLNSWPNSIEYRSLLHELVDPLTEYRIINRKHLFFQDPFTLRCIIYLPNEK